MREWYEQMFSGLDNLAEGEVDAARNQFGRAIKTAFNEVLEFLTYYSMNKVDEKNPSLQTVHAILEALLAFAGGYFALATKGEEKEEITRENLSFATRAGALLDFINLFMDPVINESNVVPDDIKEYFTELDKISDNLGALIDETLEENELPTTYEF